MNDAKDIERFRARARDAVARLTLETRQRGAMLLATGGLLDEIDVLPSGFLRARMRADRGNYCCEVSGYITRDLTCSCGAKTTCRHLAAAFLALQSAVPPPIAHDVDARPEAPHLSLNLDEWLGVRVRSLVELDAPLVLLLDLTAPQSTVRLAKRVVGPIPKFCPISNERFRRVMRGELPCEGLDTAIESLAWSAKGEALLKGPLGAFGMRVLLDSGRAFVWSPPSGGVPITLAPPRPGVFAWEHLPDGSLRSALDLGDPALTLVRTIPPYYVDQRTGAAGLVEAEGDVTRWLTAPVVERDSIPRLRKALASQKNIPVPRAKKVRRVVAAPVGVVRLQDLNDFGVRLHCAVLSFRYGDVIVADGYDGYDGVSPYVVDTPDERVAVKRDLDAERNIEREVSRAGLSTDHFAANAPSRLWTVDPAREWTRFVSESVPRLRHLGIEVVVDPSFSLRVLEPSAYFNHIEAAGTDWFNLTLGVEIANESVDLLPLLLEAIRVHGAPTKRQALDVILPSGAVARVPHARFEPLLDVLIQLVGVKYAGPGVRISRWLAMELAETYAPEGSTAEALRDARASLTRTKTLPNPRLPKAFRASLRDYQRAGLSWLSFLAEHGLGGVLADDMGLGKTVQVIALLCLRRARTAARRPSLVVAPTSVLLTWTDQLQRFAPHLRVVVWHGPSRLASPEDLRTADVVLTSYALLYRDIATLRPIAWDVLVLDEAQVIKNHASVAGKAARSLSANQRLAVTGTPVENHLGELWSVFAFVAPGLLGTRHAFQQTFRTPIEKFGISDRLDLLRRRIAPLLLRRTKEEVASELPPKTILEHPIALGQAQRDLYETVRQAVDKRVRRAIAERGFALSNIVVLDALLKLRQVCCDPALLKVDASKKRVPSAKREAFLALVETLLAEGRKVLVFSQFVEMLEFLAADLRAAGTAFSYLTGATTDRAAEVSLFQSGAVPLFLISLKAGGVGLNLTAADSVIHYDPWWNPAVEAQATDRAHRIGQDKPVFVHRLIAHGTVEGKIVALQARKADLARALLEGGAQALTLDEAIIDELLAPLP